MSGTFMIDSCYRERMEGKRNALACFSGCLKAHRFIRTPPEHLVQKISNSGRGWYMTIPGASALRSEFPSSHKRS